MISRLGQQTLDLFGTGSWAAMAGQGEAVILNVYYTSNVATARFASPVYTAIQSHPLLNFIGRTHQHVTVSSVQRALGLPAAGVRLECHSVTACPSGIGQGYGS